MPRLEMALLESQRNVLGGHRPHVVRGAAGGTVPEGGDFFEMRGPFGDAGGKNAGDFALLANIRVKVRQERE
jgi:hypothetical protein